ncbi:MAG: metallophosphoesterase [Acidobacteria bacterium]|nr:metallophosphoesterase [Acidobacteriota bacterium]MCW5969521.1 metallophosphoesterase [Blastocatellales bacterium]
MKNTILARFVARARQPRSRRTLIAMLYAAALEPYQVEITRQVIRLPRLSPRFEGFRIVQLSDIHHSPFLGEAEISAAARHANSLSPDLVVLTGDYISHSRQYIDGCARALGLLRAPLGVYAVLGNHDHWTDGERMSAALTDAGIRVLANENVAFERDGERLWLAGVDDLMVERDDLQRALGGTDRRDARVLLCHNPAIIREAARAGVDLVLSGHTHGGQINWRLLVGREDRAASRWLTRRSRRFMRGHAVLGDTHLYVNRGLGTVVVPLRYGCPPEITMLELAREER